MGKAKCRERKRCTNEAGENAITKGESLSGYKGLDPAQGQELPTDKTVNVHL
jgi:hypothetical protein